MAATDPAVNPRDLVIPSTIAALWAISFGVVISALPILLVWTLGASGAGSLGTAVRASFLAWPVSHGVPISITSVRIDLLPLLTILFPIFILRRAAIRIFRIVSFSWSNFAAIAAPIVLLNSLIGFLLAWLISDDVFAIAPFQTVFIMSIIALTATGFAAIKIYGWPKYELPNSVKFGVRVGFLNTAILLIIGMGLAVVMLGVNLASALEVAASIADTNSEKFLTWLLTFGYLPIAMIWGYAWLLGPGVATGVDSAASFAVIDQTALPALPWLAALPTTSVTDGWYLLLVPIFISVFLVSLMWWSLHNESFRTIFTNVLAGLSVIVITTVLLSLVGGGAIGPGRLAVFGPQWLPMIGGVFITIAPAFGLLLILEAVRRWFRIRKARKSNA